MGFHRGKVKTVVCTAYVCVPQVQCAMHCCGTWVVLGMASLTAVEATGCEKKEESESARARERACVFSFEKVLYNSKTPTSLSSSFSVMSPVVRKAGFSLA